MLTHKMSGLLLTACVFILAACNNSAETKIDDQRETPTIERPNMTIERPNILLIVADDLGFTDLGVYGGEIETPNIDALAKDGLILTEFHNQAVCAPTRAALLSGTDEHNAGGTMHQTPNQIGVPGYESELAANIVSLPTMLRDAGYRTYMAGKWHLGAQPEMLPNARGFDRSFALMQGGASHYGDKRGMFNFMRNADYSLNDQMVDSLPENFYSTTYYTDAVIDFIDESKDSGQPFFTYLAYTAPHWPLQAPDEAIEKYKGKYDSGYEVLRQERIKRAKDLGIIPQEAAAYPRLPYVKPWASLSADEKAVSAKEMEIYAAMVDIVDQNVGRLVDYLKNIGEYENTYIMFISDNGAEGSERDPGDNGTDWTFDFSFENMGRVNSYVVYGPEWASAGVGVHSYYKSFASEGGTRGPAIIHHPDGSKKGQISDAISTVIDFAPTALNLAGVDAPSTVGGRAVQELQGRSMLPLTLGDADRVHPEDTAFGWEVFGAFAIRKGEWKMLRLTDTANDPALRGLVPGGDIWKLFNMKTDPGETQDVSASHPEIVADLMNEWQAYISRNNMVLPIVDLNAPAMGAPAK